MVHLHDRAVDEPIAILMTSGILATLDELSGGLQGNIYIDIAAEELRLFPRLIQIARAKHEHTGGLLGPLFLQPVLYDFAVELIDCVAFRVAIIDDSVEVVELAVLLLCVEARQVLRGHQVRPQRPTVKSNLAGCGGRHADHVW